MAYNFSTPIRWGIIGVGDVCEVKSGPAFQNVAGSELVSVMRRSGELARDFAQRHGVPNWSDNADDLLNDPEINAIYIATPPKSHAEYAIKVAKAGKIVYVEKPMARTHAECLSMIDACAVARVPLFVAYYRRALPNFLKIKELLDSKTIGDVRFVDVCVRKPIRPDIVGQSDNLTNWRTDPETAGGGYFYDLACHQLDILDFLFGPISKAQGFSKNQGGAYPANDIVLGNFVFDNGVLGTGTWCFTANTASENEVTTIVGSKGQITFPFFGDHSVTLQLEGQPSQRLTFDIPVNIQQPFIQTIIDELTGVGSCPSHGESAARTNWVMEQLCQPV
ncbi:Gfo/Idh/MocA family protein [Spirosoma agri]|uniref:Gfo/Idh/MocA family oxidoreductase n=1 Tax=Spirosoma agri TaxID=1987381 RepID=A0A6M0IPA9_9BACT|nr:Gfo/Idh/MocA family oxidoreductase [Spirosoma agri]NEU69772.1 Gfo/Idh/MocA family oxidoreductase [Spirosoma agri]